MILVFVCTGNSARSIMAEAIARAMIPASAPVRIFSAGTSPRGVHPETIAVLEEAGVPVDGLSSKGLGDVPYGQAGLVVTLCDDARGSCPAPPPGARHIHWGLRDPAAGDELPEQRRERFRAARDEVRTCVKRLLFEMATDPSLRRTP
ncbi:MAG TPA: arsenate reductase ArsC [Candidatus Polarisedimenticolia bacterium]|nr:arsenate reductase ArsC [Candidatus Polarisedimenticolia bacterium]